ncbi:MAG: hypothetical protein IEMM0008_0911 [bacterium]|nr:MAG: hypothetical protein IEMM0008_0911 [bacterium]
MILKNTMEDIVIHAVEEMCTDSHEDFWKDEINRHDVACYVLNRVRAYYSTSGRGVLHMKVDHEKDVQKTADIFTLVAKGMKTVLSRRKNMPQTVLAQEPEEEDFYYFNFPCLIGKIISMTTWEGMDGAVVTLNSKESQHFVKTDMINSQWDNPYTISQETSGYFTFFPSPVKDKENQKSSRLFEFTLLFEHSNQEAIEKVFSIEVTSERAIHQSFRKSYTHRIEDIYIN